MSYIADQFAYAKAQGWLPYFVKAAKDYEFEPSLLMAIGSRESNLKNIVGDGGHGFSLMQIDVRSFPDFCHSGQWKNVALAIQKGAQVLDAKRTEIEHGEGDHLIVGSSPFVGAKVKSDADLTKTAVAAYNCGLWAFYNYSKGRDPDAFTTGKDYAHDVLARQIQFAALLKADAPAGPVVGSVSWAQARLNTLGIPHPPLVVDGDLGVKTKNAIAAFQSVKGIFVDGALNVATIKALAA